MVAARDRSITLHEENAASNISGRSRQGAPERKTQKMPLRARRSLTRGAPRSLFGSMGLMAIHFIIGEFVAHDSSPQFGSLNHRGLARRNATGQAPVGRLRGRSGRQLAYNLS